MFVFVGGLAVLVYGVAIYAAFSVRAEMQEALTEDYFLGYPSTGKEVDELH